MRQILFGILVFAVGCSVEPMAPGIPDPIITGPVTLVLLETSSHDSILAVGDSLHLKVVLRDAQNHTLEKRIVTLESSDPTVATISKDGYVRALERGEVTLIAKSEGKQGQLRLRTFLPDPCSPARPPSAYCNDSEVYVMVLYNDRPLPIHSPWGIGDWDYDEDAGTWKLTGETLTLLADHSFTWSITHTAASGNTLKWSHFGNYTRDSSGSLVLVGDGFTYPATILNNRLVIKFENGGSYTFERSQPASVEKQ